MGNYEKIEVRDMYMQLSKQLMYAIEESRPDQEIEAIHRQLKSLDPVLIVIEHNDSPDLP